MKTKLLKDAIAYCKEVCYKIRKLPRKKLYKCTDLYTGESEIVPPDVLITYYSDNNGSM